MPTSFDNSCVFISNTAKILDNETFKSLTVFWRRKDAIGFCEQWGFSKALITRVESRWQYGFAIGVGRNYFAPEGSHDLLQE